MDGVLNSAMIDAQSVGANIFENSYTWCNRYDIFRARLPQYLPQLYEWFPYFMDWTRPPVKNVFIPKMARCDFTHKRTTADKVVIINI